MKRLYLVLILVICQFSAFAQKEEDFATRFMELNSVDYSQMSCNTVSPHMMERIMKLDTLNINKNIRNVLSQLKSIQIVQAQGLFVGDSLFNRAVDLAKKNKKRYKLYATDNNRQIYLRKRNKIIVEMVFIGKTKSVFNMVNLTGNMNDSFLKELTNM